MEANIEEPLTTDEIAQHVCVSRRQLERIFKQYLNRVPSQYYLELRLNRARQMLMQTSKSIIQIGLSCGFSSGPHFSSAYRNFFGVTPREDRNQRRGHGAAEAAPVVSERG
ncbi:HTH-type transcriptional regulator CdhR [compost metagenome]